MSDHTLRALTPADVADAQIERWTSQSNTDPTPLGSTSPTNPVGAGDIVLNPSTRVLWRSVDTIQLELGSRAIVVEGVDSGLVRALDQPPWSPPDPAGRSLEAAPDPAFGVLLADGFALARAPARAPAAASFSPAPRPVPVALTGELAALRARHGARAEQVLQDRAASVVVVHGTGRLPVILGCLLAAANVGRVTLFDSGEVHRHDSSPGGLLAQDEGRRFNDAAHDAIRRAATGTDTRALGPSEQADLVVLTGEEAVDPDLTRRLRDEGTAHLVGRTGADVAVVGPLVLPGLTSCLECADLTRIDRDPAWSVLAVQLSTPRRYAGPSDIALTNLTASLAALQVLAYLDGDEPATLSASLELVLPDGRVRRRGWPPHPDCGCGAGSDGSRPVAMTPGRDRAQ